METVIEFETSFDLIKLHAWNDEKAGLFFKMLFSLSVDLEMLILLVRGVGTNSMDILYLGYLVL